MSTTSSTKLSTAAQTARYLLEIEAIKLSPESPFTWASGWKSPIYCDNRLSLSFPKVRDFITDKLVELIKTNFPSVEAIAGVATAGIPQGALVAAKLGLPFLYVRSKPKGHGMTNLIEGKLDKGQKLVVIEDLVSTGGSSLKAVEDLRAAEGEILGMAAIFTYGFSVADENFSNAGVTLRTLSDYSALIPEAIETGYVQPELLESLSAWRKDPSQWKQ